MHCPIPWFKFHPISSLPFDGDSGLSRISKLKTFESLITKVRHIHDNHSLLFSTNTGRSHTSVNMSSTQILKGDASTQAKSLVCSHII